MIEKTLWIMCGPPASGKSWFAKHKLKNGPGWMYISRDEIRFSILKEGEDYFAHENDVFIEYIKQIHHALHSEGIFNVIADATHLNWKSRNKLISNLEKIEHGLQNINIIPVVVEADMMVMLKRNEERTGRERVGHGAIRRMAMQFDDPKHDPYDYTAIMYVDNGKEQYADPHKFMYYKNDIQMKEIPIKSVIKKGG